MDAPQIARLIRSAFSPEGADLGDNTRLYASAPLVIDFRTCPTITKLIGGLVPLSGQLTKIVVTPGEVRIEITGLPDQTITLDEACGE